jgi:hypothetical protein
MIKWCKEYVDLIEKEARSRGFIVETSWSSIHAGNPEYDWMTEEDILNEPTSCPEMFFFWENELLKKKDLGLQIRLILSEDTDNSRHGFYIMGSRIGMFTKNIEPKDFHENWLKKFLHEIEYYKNLCNKLVERESEL